MSPFNESHTLLPETRYSLIARLARPEDVETWQEFLRTYEAAILRYCRTKGLQDADAADVCQHVLVAVHKAAQNWQPSGREGSFRAWLFETARRACLKRLRTRPADGIEQEKVEAPGTDLLDDMIQQEDAACQKWAFYAAAAAVQLEVEETTWRAFWRTTVENQAAQTVADELRISIGSVYTARCRVLSRIRRRVDELSIVRGGTANE